MAVMPICLRPIVTSSFETHANARFSDEARSPFGSDTDIGRARTGRSLDWRRTAWPLGCNAGLGRITATPRSNTEPKAVWVNLNI
jgi:hypothetical protein